MWTYKKKVAKPRWDPKGRLSCLHFPSPDAHHWGNTTLNSPQLFAEGFALLMKAFGRQESMKHRFSFYQLKLCEFFVFLTLFSKQTNVILLSLLKK